MNHRRTLTLGLGLLALLFLLIQLVPYRVHNPPVVQEPAWDSPRTEALARTACFDCHSNEVNTPWYGYVAPVAWVVRNHVDEGRAALNFSEMQRSQPEAHEAGEEVAEGEMPPAYYTFAHADARLSPDDRQALIAGLNATLGGEGEGGGESEEGEREGHRRTAWFGEHEDEDEDDD